jgi:hypothetical protein
MRDNVDYRLLERLRVKQRLNEQPAATPAARKQAAAAAAPLRLPAIDLRD